MVSFLTMVCIMLHELLLGWHLSGGELQCWHSQSPCNDVQTLYGFHLEPCFLVNLPQNLFSTLIICSSVQCTCIDVLVGHILIYHSFFWHQLACGFHHNFCNVVCTSHCHYKRSPGRGGWSQVSHSCSYQFYLSTISYNEEKKSFIAFVNNS